MKKIFSALAVLTLLVSLLGVLPVSAAGSVSVWVGETTVVIGDTVTVTLAYDGGGEGIGSLDAKFSYNAEVFEYLSCTGATANGGAGVVKISYYSTEVVPATTLSIALNFKALAPGDGNFSLTTEGMYSDEGTLLENHTKSVEVAASNPTLSGNADLKSLKPSKGTLTPKFDPAVTEYTISVGYDVSSLSLSATADHSDAKTSISGKNALEVGKNTRTITVTAPNGRTKKYTVVITRAKAPSTTSGTNPTTTGSTTAPPPEDALDVTVGGLHMVISDTQASVELPKGFSWSTLTINRVEVPAAVNKDTGMTLLYLIAEEAENSGYFIYDVEADSFARFRDLTVAGGTYLLYDLPAEELKGMIRGTLEYASGQVSAYVYKDVALSDFVVVWAAPMGGEAGWYTYDKKEGTIQRHHTTTVVGDTTTTPSTTTPDKEVGGEVDEEPSESFFEKNQQILLIGGIVIAGIVVLVLLFVMISSLSGRRKGKH